MFEKLDLRRDGSRNDHIVKKLVNQLEPADLKQIGKR